MGSLCDGHPERPTVTLVSFSWTLTAYSSSKTESPGRRHVTALILTDG